MTQKSELCWFCLEYITGEEPVCIDHENRPPAYAHKSCQKIDLAEREHSNEAISRKLDRALEMLDRLEATMLALMAMKEGK